MYEIEFTSEAQRHLNRLPDKVRDAAFALLLGGISENPKRVEKPLVGALEGLHSIRRGDFRIIYEVDEAELVLIVHRVQHRADVYRPR